MTDSTEDKHEGLQRVYDQQRRPGRRICVDDTQRYPTRYGSQTQ